MGHLERGEQLGVLDKKLGMFLEELGNVLRML
jgi:hypothetical protein